MTRTLADLRDEHTQAEIAERLGWNRDKVAKRSRLLNEIVPPVLDFARRHQNGRGTEDVPSGTFSEYWFRTSGLYDLNRDGVDSWDGTHAQMRVMRWFVDDQNCDAKKSAVQRQVEDIKQICEQLETLEAELNPGVDDAERAELRDEITAGTYTDETLAERSRRVQDRVEERILERNRERAERQEPRRNEGLDDDADRVHPAAARRVCRRCRRGRRLTHRTITFSGSEHDTRGRGTRVY